MLNNLVGPLSNYQSRVIGPTETVDYSTIIMSRYPARAMQIEPFIGIKVLCKDLNAGFMTPRNRIIQIEQNLGFLRNSGCIIRETVNDMPDGYWVIACPVPRSQVAQQLKNLKNILSILETNFGIIRYDDLVEVNVSGHCYAQQSEQCLSSVVIPDIYMPNLVQPGFTSPYKIGNVIRINDEYLLLRTRWHFKRLDDAMIIGQMTSSIFH